MAKLETEHPSHGWNREENAEGKAFRFELTAFDDVKLQTAPTHLIESIIPREGLTVVWGPPKCGKSFWAFDAAMHVALGWSYRERRVQQGVVVYIAAEGAHGFRKRIEAFRQNNDIEGDEPVPFYLVPSRLDLIEEVKTLISDIRAQAPPILIVIDTLNRTLVGSESRDEDMAAYIKAVDAIREAFECAVLVVHHCGIATDRPRGHTSLAAAADTQIKVERSGDGTITTEVEMAKDDVEGAKTHSRLEVVEVGRDDDGEPIMSCVIVEADEAPAVADTGPRLTANQQTMFAILKDAGSDGLSLDDWNEQTRVAGVGTKRRATLHDIRVDLKRKGLVYESSVGRWLAKP